MATTDQIFEMVQGMNDHILDLVDRTGKLAGQVESSSKAIDDLKEEQEELAEENKKLIGLIQKSMTPDRCAYMHDELAGRIKKDVFETIKKGARGWASTAITVLKILAYAGLAFGGSAMGAQAMLKITGG